MPTLSNLRPQNDATTPTLELASQLSGMLGLSAEMPLREEDADLLSAMEVFRFGTNNSRTAWSIGEGPVVMLVHGYSGRASQMIRLAQVIADKGFRSVLFDAGGHGASRKEKIGFFTFINDVRDLAEYLNEPLHAIVGHSAGGVAAMQARRLYGVPASRYAMISAPIYPYVPLNAMRERGAPEEVITALKLNIADQFRTKWSSLVAGEAFAPEPGKALLLAYDLDDIRVQHEDADQIALIWPGAQILKTTGYGHNKILAAEEVLDRVRTWL